MHVNIIEDVLGALKIVAIHPVPMDELAELGPLGELRRCLVAEVCEDEPDRFTCRVRRDLHLAAEGLRLGGLRSALARRVEGPAVVSTGELLSSYPAGRELRPAMWAAMHHDV